MLVSLLDSDGVQMNEAWFQPNSISHYRKQIWAPTRAPMGSVHSYETKAGKKLYRIVYRRPDHKQTQERGFTRRRDAELRLAELRWGRPRETM